MKTRTQPGGVGVGGGGGGGGILCQTMIMKCYHRLHSNPDMELLTQVTFCFSPNIPDSEMLTNEGNGNSL